MTTRDDIAKIQEQMKYLPRYFDELRGDILRLAESFQEELDREKKRGANSKRSATSLLLGLPSWKEERGAASRTPGRSSAARGLLRYLK